MSYKRCPKCERFCAVSGTHLELGLLIECACGCKFEALPSISSAYPSQTKEPQAQKTPDESPSPVEKKKKFVWKHLFSPLLVIAGVGVVYASWQANWPKSLFVVSVALTIFCWRQKRSWKKYDDKSLSHFFFDKCVEFFVPLTAVLVFYAILAGVVDGTTNQATLGMLEKLESLMDSIYSYVAWFKLKPWIAALFITGIIVVDLFLSLFFKYKDMASWHKHYNTWSKRVYTIVVLLCCFTFFGNAVGEKRAHLRTRTDKIREGYARIQEEAEKILSGSVQQKVYEKVQSTFPPNIRTEFNYPKNIDEKLTDLRVSLEYAEVLKVKDEKAVEILRRYETSAKQPSGFSEEPIRYSEIEPSPQPKIATPPPDVSEASVERSLVEIETKKSFRSRFVSLIKLDGTKQLFCQFPKSFTNVAKSAVFKTVMVKYPILEPVVDVFVGTFDKAVEEKVKASVDKVTAALLKDPLTADQVATGEAEKIVDSVKIKESPTITERIKTIVGDIHQKYKDIDAALERVKDRMNATAEARASDPTIESENQTKTPGERVSIFTCKCGSRLIWGPLRLTKAQALALCPPGPCR